MLTMQDKALNDQTKTEKFNQLVLHHLDAAYNLANWLTRNSHDAEDLVQESFIKAFRHIDSFRGSNARTWVLMIVRNTCYTWLKAKQNLQLEEYDDETVNTETNDHHNDPAQIAILHLERSLINAAILQLPIEFREVLVLREQEGFSYQEIAEIVGIPIGTVMSRLARARNRMQDLLAVHFSEEVKK